MCGDKTNESRQKLKISNKYTKAGTFYMFGNLFNKGIVFLTIPLFTRILTVYDYGVVNTYMSWQGILTMVLGLTLHMGIRSAFVDYKDDMNNFMSSITFLDVLSSVIISIVIIAATILFKINVPLVLLILCLVHSFSNTIINNYKMYLMMKIKYKLRTVLLMLPNLLINIIAVILIVYVYDTDKYMGKILPSALVTFMFALIILPMIYSKGKTLVNINYWKYALKVSVPIIFHGLSLMILSQSDRIMLTSLVDATETGIYSLVYNFSMIANVVVVSLESVWVPWYTEKLKNRKITEINERVKIYMGIVTITMLFIILAAPEMLSILAPESYANGKLIVPPIVISSFVIFIYTIYVNVEYFHKDTKIIALNTLMAAALNIILNLIFIPRYGMYAAAGTTLVSYMMSLVMHYRHARKIETELFPLSSILIPLVVIFTASILYYVLLPFAIIRWSILVIVIIIVYFKYKNKIMQFIR